ncbi:hypothetical protein IWZ00DRAFT_340680 [Phyllosticta capitalensis]
MRNRFTRKRTEDSERCVGDTFQVQANAERELQPAWLSGRRVRDLFIPQLNLSPGALDRTGEVPADLLTTLLPMWACVIGLEWPCTVYTATYGAWMACEQLTGSRAPRIACLDGYKKQATLPSKREDKLKSTLYFTYVLEHSEGRRTHCARGIGLNITLLGLCVPLLGLRNTFCPDTQIPSFGKEVAGAVVLHNIGGL